MWIISKKYGAVNTDNLSAIKPPVLEIDSEVVYAYDSGRGFCIANGNDYQKILAALVNGDNFVEVP